jgi:hypothetical protein
MDNYSLMIGPIFDEYVKPVVRLKVLGSGKYQPIKAVGTGFTFGAGIFITCWHCVAEPLDADEVYAVPIRQEGEDAVGVAILTDLARDDNGSDLALAQAGIELRYGFHLAGEAAGWEEDVVACGYPLPVNTIDPEARTTLIQTQARVLRGYVMSEVMDDLHSRQPSRVYELDMPAPRWSSGSPLFRREPFEIVGVVLGESSKTIGDEDEPFTYALAHHLDVLANAQSSLATGGMTLRDYLDSKRA